MTVHAQALSSHDPQALHGDLLNADVVTWLQGREAEMQRVATHLRACADALRGAAEAPDVLTVTRDDYESWRGGRREVPSHWRVVQAFGSHERACRFIGVLPGRCAHPTEAPGLNALSRVAGQLGHAPSVTAYDKHRAPGEPAARTLCRRAGSWPAAQRAASLTLTL